MTACVKYQVLGKEQPVTTGFSYTECPKFAGYSYAWKSQVG